MKLYKISQKENINCDTYDSAICAAQDECDARMIHPDKLYPDFSDSDAWVSNPNNVIVEYIGEAKEGTERGLILASFNAG